MHTTARRLLILGVLAVSLLGVGAAASASDVVAQTEPYIEVEVAESEAVEPQWTYRYLIPTTIALTILLIGGTVVMYFVKVVRSRYTVVE